MLIGEGRKPICMRQIWKIPGLGPRTNLIFECKNKDFILLCLERSGVPRLDSVVKAYQTEARDNPLAKYRSSASDDSGSSQTSEDVFLPAGESLQAEIITNGKTTKSPAFTP